MERNKLLLFVPYVLILALAGISVRLPLTHQDPQTPVSVDLVAPTASPSPSPTPVVNVQTGMASWYGHQDGFHGQKTASGEIFNADDFTAAHLHLKFGTKVKVTNLKNGKQITVRINDRGPYVEGRIIDLSEASAKEIGISGVGKVKLEW